MGLESDIEREQLPEQGALSFSLDALSDLKPPKPTLDPEQQVSISHDLERERHYFLPRTELENLVRLEQLPSTEISQSYFPKDFAKGAWAMIAMTHGSVPLDSSAEITQARVRRAVSSEGEVTYEFTLKYKEAAAGVGEKQEVTVPLTGEMYQELLPFATNGTVAKRRYSLNVPVGLQSGSSLGADSASIDGKVALEIDIPLSCMNDRDIRDLRSVDIALIDIECDTISLMESLRDGKHGIALLHQCIDISSDRDSTHHLRKPLSWKEIAKSGFKKKALKSVQALADLHRSRVAA